MAKSAATATSAEEYLSCWRGPLEQRLRKAVGKALAEQPEDPCTAVALELLRGASLEERTAALAAAQAEQEDGPQDDFAGDAQVGCTASKNNETELRKLRDETQTLKDEIQSLKDQLHNVGTPSATATSRDGKADAFHAAPPVGELQTSSASAIAARRLERHGSRAVAREEVANAQGALDEPAIGEAYAEAALAALDSIQKRPGDLVEIKCMKRPPKGVEDVFNACQCLLQAEAGTFSSIDTSWQHASKLLANPNAFFEDLRSVICRIRTGTLPAGNVESVQKLAKHAQFEPDLLRKASNAVANLCAFVLNALSFHEVVEQARRPLEASEALGAVAAGAAGAAATAATTPETPPAEDLDAARAEGALLRAPPLWTCTQASFRWASEDHQAGPLAAALEQGTQLIDAGYLADLAESGGIVPRCQDVEARHVVSLDEMERWHAGHSLAVLVLSYAWLAPEHPDPEGYTLREVSFVLRAFAAHAVRKYGGGCRVGVFWDYLSLPQRSRGCPEGEDDRTDAQVAAFRRGLTHINTWYAHPKTYVLLVNTPLPAGAASAQPYAGRGWCCAERAMASMVKSTYCLLDLSRLGGDEAECDELIIKAAAERATEVMAPPAFRSWLFDGVAAGEVRFTNPTDVALVANIYAAAFSAEFSRVAEMRYDQTGMGNADACVLAESIRHAHEQLGALRKLTLLDLSFNHLGDEGCAAVARALLAGAMPNLESLRLRGNAIGDEGMEALSRALASAEAARSHGALRDVRISGNPASERAQEGVQAATSAMVFTGRVSECE